MATRTRRPPTAAVTQASLIPSPPPRRRISSSIPPPPPPYLPRPRGVARRKRLRRFSAELGRELVGWRTISRLVCSLSISARNKDKEEKSLLAACFPVPPSTPPQQHLITYATNEMAGTDGEREQVCRAWLKDDT